MGRLSSIAVATAAAAFAFGAGQTASAADLPVKAQPVPVATGWTGWYAGVNLGGIFGDSQGSGPADRLFFGILFFAVDLPPTIRFEATLEV